MTSRRAWDIRNIEMGMAMIQPGALFELLLSNRDSPSTIKMITEEAFINLSMLYLWRSIPNLQMYSIVAENNG